ncbi:hypothetical protein [Terrimonas sp.]|uniref:hypothetical protein n=1 Tax=Terrimonas sp. TaxID=1914338 RepID=UPI001981638E|nr:hypothetical protein [Terrimonas sp.]
MGLVLLVIGYFFFNGILNIESSRMYAAKVVYSSLILSTIFTVMTVPYDAVINARENMFYYAIVGIIESMLKLSAALAIVYFGGDKLILYGILMACIPLIIMTIMRVYCHRKYEECVLSPRKYWDKGLMKEMTSFAGWGFLTSSSGIVANYGQGLIVNMFFGSIVNAAMGVANQINGQLSVFSANLIKAINPVIYKSEGAGNREGLLRVSIIGSKLSFFLLALLAIPFIIEMPAVLKFWLKNVPDYAVVFCQCQLLLSLLLQLFFLLSTTLAAQGKIAKASMIKSIIIISPIPLIYLFFKMNAAPYWMYLIVAIVQILREMVNLYFVNKYCGLSYKTFIFSVLVRCMLVFILVFGFTFFIHLFIEDSLARFIIVALSSTILLFFSIYFIGLNPEERYLFRNIINKKLLKRN